MAGWAMSSSETRSMAANNARGQSNVRLVAISVGILAGLLGVTTAVIIGTRDDQGSLTGRLAA